MWLQQHRAQCVPLSRDAAEGLVHARPSGVRWEWASWDRLGVLVGGAVSGTAHKAAREEPPGAGGGVRASQSGGGVRFLTCG